MRALSVSCWICLLTLAAVMLVHASGASISVGLPCCINVTSHRVRTIIKCNEQKPRVGCNHHAFVIKNKKHRTLCIDPAAQWLQVMIQNGQLSCPPDISLS
ncbi:hypothetical protein Q5P01_004457 [Channa striata]|uniref:Chemokine interleukin-8-like domain-containing protein n=1 Tax=Channa striata TaxID=64152 RepID=A0AA88NJI0_CHASR|nr:hypothetical protein Q5P01_004457 [Channa striata]